MLAPQIILNFNANLNESIRLRKQYIRTCTTIEIDSHCVGEKISIFKIEDTSPIDIDQSIFWQDIEFILSQEDRRYMSENPKRFYRPGIRFEVLYRFMHGETLEQIGDDLGFGRERTRQLKEEALNTLKTNCEDYSNQYQIININRLIHYVPARCGSADSNKTIRRTFL